MCPEARCWGLVFPPRSGYSDCDVITDLAGLVHVPDWSTVSRPSRLHSTSSRAPQHSSCSGMRSSVDFTHSGIRIDDVLVTSRLLKKRMRLEILVEVDHMFVLRRGNTGMWTLIFVGCRFQFKDSICFHLVASSERSAR